MSLHVCRFDALPYLGLPRLRGFLRWSLLLVVAANVSRATSLLDLNGVPPDLKKAAVNQVAQAIAPEVLTSKQPITTSLSDAKWGDPTKDGFVPPVPRLSLMTLQRTPNGGFVLQKGYFSLPTQSYCLKAGTHGPSKGDGYLYAPPKGPAEDVVMTIVRNSVQHPEIPQTDIQVLLWAIIARAKFEDFPPKVKETASHLLTERQLASINRSALDLLPGPALDQAMAKLPPAVREVAHSEAQLRQMLKVNRSFQEMERAAMLNGNVGIGEGSQNVPTGRWSKHPDGYYVRYLPKHYSFTIVELWIPDDSPAIGREYDPATHVAVPGNTNRQRLIQSGRVQVDPLDAIRRDPAITTALIDAKWGQPDKDGFVPPQSERSFMELQRTPNGGWVLQPGFFALQLESYSVNLNERAPAEGDPYLYAPIKGPAEDVVMTLLRNAVNHPDISQQDLQSLIWGVIAHVKMENLAPKYKVVAQKLLTPRQIAAADAKAVTLSSGADFDRLFASVPMQDRPLYKAEAQVREILCVPNLLNAYGGLQQIAFHSSSPTPAAIGTPTPSGRWSLHPDGYFVRYLPRRYNSMRVEIWVPQNSPATGKEFDPATQVAMPTATGHRLIACARIQQSLVDQLLNHPAITTQLKDARFGDVSMDGFVPGPPKASLMTLQRTPNGGFVLQAGYFGMAVESFSLDVGKADRGEGYLFAVPKGPAADPVMAIVRNAVNHPEVSRQDIQLLLWALMAHAKYDTLAPAIKTAADRLQIRAFGPTMNAMAVDLLPGPQLDRALDECANADDRRALQTEAQVRKFVSTAGVTFGEVERTALLRGNPPLSDRSLKIPVGRWSKHPDGYWVRYVPGGYYDSTMVEIWVPKDSPAIGREFDPATHITVPGNIDRSRLILSGRPTR